MKTLNEREKMPEEFDQLANAIEQREIEIEDSIIADARKVFNRYFSYPFAEYLTKLIRDERR